MRKEIQAWVWNPANSLFKQKKSEKAVGHILYCDCPEKCQLYAKGNCVLEKNSCPHGGRGRVAGYSRMASKFSTWIREFEESHKEAMQAKLTQPQKLEYFMDYVYIPIAYLNMNKNIDFYDGGGLMSLRRPIIKRDIFTAEFIGKQIVNFVPRAFFDNGVIEKYQKEEVPKFLIWLKELDNDLYEQVKALSPEHKGFISMTNVGRQAVLKTLNPNVGEFKDIHGGLWVWDGEYLTSYNTHASFTLVDTREIEECRIKPKDRVIVMVTDDKQVNTNTEFID